MRYEIFIWFRVHIFTWLLKNRRETEVGHKNEIQRKSLTTKFTLRMEEGTKVVSRNLQWQRTDSKDKTLTIKREDREEYLRI